MFTLIPVPRCPRSGACNRASEFERREEFTRVARAECGGKNPHKGVMTKQEQNGDLRTAWLEMGEGNMDFSIKFRGGMKRFK